MKSSFEQENLGEHFLREKSLDTQKDALFLNTKEEQEIINMFFDSFMMKVARPRFTQWKEEHNLENNLPKKDKYEELNNIVLSDLEKYGRSGFDVAKEILKNHAASVKLSGDLGTSLAEFYESLSLAFYNQRIEAQKRYATIQGIKLESQIIQSVMNVTGNSAA